MNEDVLKGSSMTVALETGNTTDGTVILTADSTGKVMVALMRFVLVMTRHRHHWRLSRVV